jgi:hypothetical protein
MIYAGKENLWASACIFSPISAEIVVQMKATVQP